MNVQTSDWGLAFTAANPACVQDFEAAVTSYLAAHTDTMARLEAILEQDPDMPMAICFQGYLLKLAAHPKFGRVIDRIIARLQGLVDEGRCNAREQAHVAALQLWCQGHDEAAVAELEAVLERDPLDMLALRIAHYLHFYSGKGDRMCDSTARVLPAWDEKHPHFAYLQGMHAFGLEESARYPEALEFGQAAVAANSADIWATHAVAHVHQMQGQHEEGVRWLQALQHEWLDTNNFRYHVIWHEALHWLGLGEAEQALRIYDERLAASVTDDFYLDVCNNAALLWRLQFLGLDVGERWQALVELCEQHSRDRELLFASLHYLIPLVIAGSEQAATLIETLSEWATEASDQGKACAEVGVNLAQAIAQSPATPEAAAELLTQSAGQTYLIGGSKAQRDLFRLLALDDAERAGRPDLVAALC